MRTCQTLFAALVLVFTASCATVQQPPPAQARDLTPVKFQPTPAHRAVEIVRGGRACAKVYLADPKPSKNLQLLVKELVEDVRLSTGAELEQVAAMPPADVPAIVIGDCAESRKAGIDAAGIPMEGFVVKTAPMRVYLVGSTLPLPENENIAGSPYGNDGTAWAVADFLERFVGVRWYWPTQAGGRSIVKADTLLVPPVHYSDQPVFRKREFYPYRYEKPWKSRWFEKDGPTLPASALPTALDAIEMVPLLPCLRSGNSWPYIIKVHQPQSFANDPKRWEPHAAMFQKNKDGSPNYNMLCYSSQEAFDFLIQGCEDAWTHNKVTGAVPWVTSTCVTISPGDYPVHCYCASCDPLFEPGRSPYGSASRIMGRFVKKFCEEVKRRWPDKKVLYLPYWNYTMCPEDIDFPDNLEVQMCTMAFALMRQPAQRARMENSMRAWSRKVDGKISTWEYSHRVPEWTHAPVQHPHLVQDYYRTNRDVIVGSFLNGGGIAEWTKSSPTLHCWMKVLWNPEVDIDAILDGFCERMFGRAAGTTRELLRLMCERWETAQWRQSLGDAGRVDAPVFADTWPPEVVAKMTELGKQARTELKDDPAALQRFEYWTWTFEPFLKEAREEWAKAGIKAE